MPIVKASIEGREYAFAPLKFKELQALQDAKTQSATVFESVATWKPYIQSSIERAGGAMPDLEDLDIDVFNRVFSELVRGVMKASGVELAPVGEVQPAAMTSGMTSTAS